MARQDKTKQNKSIFTDFFHGVDVLCCMLAIVLYVSNVNASNWKIGFDVSVLMYVTQNGPPFEQSLAATLKHSALTTGLSGSDMYA